MLAAGGSRLDVVGVELVRRGDIHDIDFRIGAQRFNGRKDAAAEFRGKSRFASGRGSAPATSSTRGSAVNVGSISVNARPSPAAPTRNLGSVMRNRPAV
jgi:hypothetical protein